MSTEALVDEVVARLLAAIVSEDGPDEDDDPDEAPSIGLVAKIEKYPAEAEWARCTHPLCTIWVGYQGSNYGPEMAVDVPIQDREILFDVTIIVRNLTGPKGAGVYCDLVRSRLHGFKLGTGHPLAMKSERYVDSKNGLFRHELVVGTKTLAVPKPDVPASPGVKFVLATIESILSGENTDVAAPA